MGSDGLRIAPEQVREAGRFAFKIAQDLKGALRSAGIEVDSLMSSGWTGTAADSYGAGWRELHDGGVQVFEALTEMADLLGVSANNYRDQDSAGSRSISSLRLD